MILTIILATAAVAFVTPEPYRGTVVKFYDNSTNKADVYSKLDIIEDKYFENLFYIKIFEVESAKYAGYYNWFGGINIFRCIQNCNQYVINHEFAHHCQYLNGETLYSITVHDQSFRDCENEIWEGRE